MNVTMKDGDYDLDLDQCESLIEDYIANIGGSVLSYVFRVVYVCVVLCMFGFVCVLCACVHMLQILMNSLMKGPSRNLTSTCSLNLVESIYVHRIP